MTRKSYKEKLHERILEGICEIEDIPTDDKGLYGMYGGLNIVEMGIGQFADLNISIEDQKHYKISGDELEKWFEYIDNQKEVMIMQWRRVINNYICEIKEFSRKSKEQHEWFDRCIKESYDKPEWTIEMYSWALKFLESLRRKLICDIIANKVASDKS